MNTNYKIKVDNVALVYPLQSDLSHLDGTWKFADGKKSVSILHIDLERLIEGRIAFRGALIDPLRRHELFIDSSWLHATEYK